MEAKKIKKKLAHCLKILRNHEPMVRISVTPTHTVFVGNGGMDCQVTGEMLQQLFDTFGFILSIHMPFHRPYAFVRYESIEGAQRSVETLQGVRPGEHHPQLFLTYVEDDSFSDAKPNFESCDQPKGCLVTPNFISVAEEDELITFAERALLQQDNQDLKHRKVLHFGYKFVYGSNTIDFANSAQPIPITGAIPVVAARIFATGSLINMPDQLTINVYEPGQGIPLHTDTHSCFQETISSLSLGSDIMFTMQNPASGRTCDIPLRARSLLVLTDEARYVWKHGILPRRHDQYHDGRTVRRERRISFTFRAVRRVPCECQFREFCDRDHVNRQAEYLPTSEVEAVSLEERCVHEVYDNIADHFDNTRYALWPGVVSFLDKLCLGDILLDVGCGNGKYLEGPSTTLMKIGCDRSVSLCDICVRKGCSVFQANCVNLPVRNSSVDAVISIAVLHHLSTEARRSRAVQECLRVLRPGGQALIYVWAMEQSHEGKKSAYLKHGSSSLRAATVAEDTQQDRIDHNDAGCSADRDALTDATLVDDRTVLSEHKNKTPFKRQDLLVPWIKADNKQATGEKTLRFYHVFKDGELASLCRALHCVIRHSYYEQGNWCIVLEKL